VRNAGNAQLAWSEDRGHTWQWGFQFETSFGSPSFLNFGANYKGARDSYVYTYSQDGPSAYDSDDGVLLARVPKSAVRQRDAWEFLVRVDSSSGPVWSRDIAERGHVFHYPARSHRVDAVYNRGLKRYMLALAYNHDGGWGLFDAPEPWGPWTTAFHTLRWDAGATHGYRLPAKWIRSRGKTIYVVFSGVSSPEPNYDAFCVRRATLNLR
jgi:hypothetical protein